MVNPTAPNNHSVVSKVCLIASLLILTAGIMAFYLMAQYSIWLRAFAMLGAGLVAAIVASFSSPGKTLIAFTKDSFQEMHKVVWPTRKEAGQTTLIVFGFVLIMALYLWLGDKLIEWSIFSLILGWR